MKRSSASRPLWMTRERKDSSEVARGSSPTAALRRTIFWEGATPDGSTRYLDRVGTVESAVSRVFAWDSTFSVSPFSSENLSRAVEYLDEIIPVFIYLLGCFL